jgi:ribonuclease HI
MQLRPFSPTLHIGTDASRRGWGGAVSWEGGKSKMAGSLGIEMAGGEVSSNQRELRAVRETLEVLVRTGVRGKDILVESDNMTTVANINRRSCATSLLPEMLRLFDLLECTSIRLRVSYIPGTENTEADELSRQADSTDYSMDAGLFLELMEELGVTIGIDLFARADNAKAGRYYSWRPAHGALGTDALAQSWKGEENTMYAFPPTTLISKVINKLAEDGGSMVIITPVWKAAPWMRQLEDMTVERRYLGEILEFAYRGNLIPTENKDPPGEWMASLLQV